ncbi:MAG: hypothetical protein V3T61_09000, partial [Acidobacteriota bacterium]
IPNYLIPLATMAVVAYLVHTYQGRQIRERFEGGTQKAGTLKALLVSLVTFLLMTSSFLLVGVTLESLGLSQ